MEGTCVLSPSSHQFAVCEELRFLLRTQRNHRGKLKNGSVLTHQRCFLALTYDPDPPPAAQAVLPARLKERSQRFGLSKYSSEDAGFFNRQLGSPAAPQFRQKTKLHTLF